MKRSEILNMISDEFYYCNVEPEDAILKAERLLSKLEANGMLPPKYTHKDPGHFPGDNFQIELNEWEEE